MLIDAIRAELLRFSRNTSAWLWALLVIPFGTAITGILARHFLVTKISNATQSLPAELHLPKSPLNLGDVITDQTASLAGISLLAFFLIAPAVIAATDYRWETWRLIRPRNSRLNLILGKAIAIALIALIPLALFLLCETLGRIFSATLEDRRIVLGFDGEQFGATVMMFVIAWLRTLQVAGLALLAGIVTRSIFGGYVIPIGFSAGTFLLAQMLQGFGWEPTQWKRLLLFPATGHDLIQSYLAGGPVSGETLTKSLIGLFLWLLAPPALAVWWFQRQDLPKE